MEMKSVFRGDNDYLELIPTSSQRPYPPASDWEINMARDYLSEFMELCDDVLRVDPARTLYSVHALLDEITAFLNSPDKERSDDLIRLFSMVLQDHGFLFHEERDRYCVQKQNTFKEVFLNRTYLFHHDIPKDLRVTAMDFAMGLGNYGDFDNFFSLAASYLPSAYLGFPKNDINKIPPKHREIVEALLATYENIAGIVCVEISELCDFIREQLRISAKNRLKASKLSVSLFTSLCEWRDKKSTKKHKALQETYPSNLEEEALFAFCNKIAKEYCYFMGECTKAHKQLQPEIFSKEQVQLITPRHCKIIIAPSAISLSDIKEQVTIKYEEVVKQQYDDLQDKRDKQAMYRIIRLQKKGMIMPSNWSEYFEPNQHQIDKFRDIISGYLNASSSKSGLTESLIDEFWKDRISFLINEDFFIYKNAGTEIPLAPIIAFSMICTGTRAFLGIKRKWSIGELIKEHPLNKDNKSMLLVGLYIRLRNFFGQIKKSSEAVLKAQDSIFCSMTGYHVHLMIATDAKNDSFELDRWAIDTIGDAYHEPQCDQPLKDNNHLPHTEAYRQMHQRETGKAIEVSIKKMIKRDAKSDSMDKNWIAQYRALRCTPSHKVEFEKLWKRFAIEHFSTNTGDLKAAIRQLTAGIIPVTYTKSCSRYQKFRPDHYPRAVFETILQQELVRESLEKAKKIGNSISDMHGTNCLED